MSEENPILEEILEEIPEGQGENLENKSVEQVDKLDPEIQKRDAQIKHWREKAQKLEKQVPADKTENVGDWTASKDPFEVVRLGKVLKDYDDQETEFIIRNAPSKDIDGIIKSANDEMVQFAIKSRREKVVNEKKVPGSTSTGFSSNEKKITPQTSPEEAEKILQERWEKAQSGSSSD
jgi:hypothetical protein